MNRVINNEMIAAQDEDAIRAPSRGPLQGGTSELFDRQRWD